MKTITLWWIFIKKNIIPIIITLLLLTVALFIMVSYYGKYRYVAYARDIMLNSDLRNGGYFMISFDDELRGDPEKMEPVVQSVRKQITEYTACKYLLTTDAFAASALGSDNNDFYNCFLYDDHMISGMRLSVDDGRWLSSDAARTEAVICGNSSKKKVGDRLTLSYGIEAEVVGIINDVPLYPTFSRSGNAGMPARSLFKNGDSMLFITGDAVPEITLNNIQYYYHIGNCYVVLEESATDSYRTELFDFMESLGIYVPYEKIIADSDAEIDVWLYQAFPLPLFLIIVCTISALCICIVVVKRSMSEYSKYYLMGCTKNKCIFHVTAPLVVLFSIPCFLNLLNVMFFPHFLRAGDRYPVDYILDHHAVILIIVFSVLVILPIIFMPRVFYRNYSPLSLYRRNM